MAYHLSAAKLQTYDRCPQAYYFRYERGLSSAPFYNSALLGTALHQALAQIYRDWHYQNPLPDLAWIDGCWEQQLQGLSPMQVNEGRTILRQYYQNYIAGLPALQRPLAVEGKIQGHLQVENLEFVLTGRYDRLDLLEDGLELIDYKSSKELEERSLSETNLQLGLYYLALEQKYAKSLKRLKLIFLRINKEICYEVTPDHKQEVQTLISNLALRLRTDQTWEPAPTEHCLKCGYARYCPAMQSHPDPLPEAAKPAPGLQLTLSL
jgi:putative RecB family exonuclease